MDAFNQDPRTDAKDQTYRLYTMVEVCYSCDDKGKITVGQPKTDKEGGKEGPGVYGTINHSGATVKIIRGGTAATISWKGWGRPAKLVEPGMQWVAKRTSVNIWHRPEIRLRCDKEKGFYRANSFEHSKFPSHKLWIDGKLEKDKKQGDFAELWNPDPVDKTFVK